MNTWLAALGTLALLYRAITKKSLTPLGTVAAASTAITHAIHPWGVFYALLVVFFLAGTRVTKIKHEIKATLTHSSAGSAGGEGPRGYIQVLANSFAASVLIVAHAFVIRQRSAKDHCLPYKILPLEDTLVFGIVANYAAVASDTFSSELGILSKSKPRLVIAPWQTVAPGTNGGVSLAGLLAGLLGSFIISTVATLLIPFCDDWTYSSKAGFLAAMTLVGLGGSVLDSVLGALCQASVIDVRSGKVIEGIGGRKVPVAVATAAAQDKSKDRGTQSRKIAVGRDILSNNSVNFVMATSLSVVAMLGAGIVWSSKP